MNEKGWSTDRFRSHLRSGIEELCTEHGYKYDNEQQRGFAFQYWVATLIAEHEGLDENDLTVFSTNDLKVDVAGEDLDQKALYLIQTKYLSPTRNPPIDEGLANDFMDRHIHMLNGEWVAQHANDELLEYVGDYKDRLDDGWSVHWYFVATGAASDRTKGLISEKETIYKSDNPGVSLHLLDFYGLKEYFIESETVEQSIPDFVEFNLAQGRWIVRNNPRKTLVAVVKANTLVNLYRKERERLFAYNIRSFLGRKGINKDIAATAATHPDEFFYFNNGISAICTHFDFDDRSGRFHGDNFQIINGAQTIGALKAVKDLSSDVEVLIRVTEGESVKTEKGFNADVIKFNNTQNIVKSSDFRSNDAIQLWLENKFASLRPRGAVEKRVAYTRKRSYRKHRGTDVLRLEDLAKIRYTWLFEPTRAIADPKSLWAFAADGGNYEDAFGIEGEGVTSWNEDTFRDCLLAATAYWEIESRTDKIIKNDRKMLWLRRLRFFALHLFKIFLEERSIQSETILDSRAEFDRVFGEFWPDAFRELISAYQDAVNSKITAFALARSETRWTQTREKFAMFERHK